MQEYLVWIWLAVTAISLIIEFITLDLVSVWCVGGGVVAMISAICHAPLWLQIVLFLSVTLILLFSFRKITLKYLLKGETKTNTDSLIDQTYTLVTGVTKDKMGTVSINDVVWNVKTQDSSVISKNSLVKIIKIEGNKLIVEKVSK